MASHDPCVELYELIDRVYVKLELLESRMARDAARNPRGAAAKLWILEEIYDSLARLRKAARECLSGSGSCDGKRSGAV